MKWLPHKHEDLGSNLQYPCFLFFKANSVRWRMLATSVLVLRVRNRRIPGAHGPASLIMGDELQVQ